MQKEMESRYEHDKLEDGIYEAWENSKLFSPEGCLEEGVVDPKAPHFSIVLPPPNVTGRLHMGHAAMLAIEDIMVRYNRMNGLETLWVPGTDHAAIATQSKVEEIYYKKDGKTRHDYGRDEFLKMVEAYAKESHDTITSQVKKMGASVDWKREAYTLDAERNLAVRTAFKEMYEDGLIYQGMRLVNWDPKLKTNVSDDEVEWMEETIPFYYFQYGPFVIGTSRPETKFGDKYVVMHPKDERYKQYNHGDKIDLEWINGPITATIIKDEAIDMEFGTGVMTITPWHDAADFEIAERHNLDKEPIIGLDGKLLPIAGEFAGVHIKKARPLIVRKLEEKGLLVKTEEKYVHRVATNSRGGGVIEPQIQKQWFIGVNKPFVLKHSEIDGIPSGRTTTLKEIMRKVVESGQIKIMPERFLKTYYHWIDNLRDWCISRQIWYGHRIPVWYKGDEIFCGIEPPLGDEWEQDPDTLDTWFSSGLWTFSTLGWPHSASPDGASRSAASSDLERFHPTSVLETGYDILFFWVARMILMTGYNLGTIPFKNVYLHGLVRDGQGRKMSKSLGNIIDPLDMISKYGADATRLSLIIGAAPGNDIKLSEDRVRGYRNFSTKIWNAARFVLMRKPEERLEWQKSEEDEAILSELNRTREIVKRAIDDFDFNLAGDTLYHYFWHTFADKIIETQKPKLLDGTPAEKSSAYQLLETILLESLTMLHPFIPFVTEAVYQRMLEENGGADKAKNLPRFLMVRRWS